MVIELADFLGGVGSVALLGRAIWAGRKRMGIELAPAELRSANPQWRILPPDEEAIERAVACEDHRPLAGWKSVSLLSDPSLAKSVPDTGPKHRSWATLVPGSTESR